MSAFCYYANVPFCLSSFLAIASFRFVCLYVPLFMTTLCLSAICCCCHDLVKLISTSSKTPCSVILLVNFRPSFTTRLTVKIFVCSLHKIRVGTRTVLKAYRSLSGHVEDSHQIVHIEKDIRILISIHISQGTTTTPIN